MKLIHFLAGFAGNKLTLGATDHVVWLDYSAMAVGEIGKLRLAPNGVDPGSPDGFALAGRGPLEDYYGDAVRLLGEQMKPDGYQVTTFPFDWRKDLRTAGEALADTIQEFASETEPSTIVGHSTGGLVARWAFLTLLKRNQASLVRRIVTLGTPHLGTYSAVGLLCNLRDELKGISLLNCLGTRTLAPHDKPPSGNNYFTDEDLMILAATWPALYQLFPFFDGTPVPFDGDRDKLYTAGNWPLFMGVSQAHLNTALNPWQSTLTDPANIPPPHVMTMIAGYGNDALVTLADWHRLGQPAALALQANAGDSTVAIDSALGLPGVKVKMLFGHMDLPIASVEAGILRREILAERIPVIPPETPPAVRDLIQFPTLVDPTPPRPRFAPIPFPTRQAWDSVRDP